MGSGFRIRIKLEAVELSAKPSGQSTKDGAIVVSPIGDHRPLDVGLIPLDTVRSDNLGEPTPAILDSPLLILIIDMY